MEKRLVCHTKKKQEKVSWCELLFVLEAISQRAAERTPPNARGDSRLLACRQEARRDINERDSAAVLHHQLPRRLPAGILTASTRDLLQIRAQWRLSAGGKGEVLGKRTQRERVGSTRGCEGEEERGEERRERGHLKRQLGDARKGDADALGRTAACHLHLAFCP